LPDYANETATPALVSVVYLLKQFCFNPPADPMDIRFLLLAGAFGWFGYRCVLTPRSVQSQPGGHFITKCPLWVVRILGLLNAAIAILFVYMALRHGRE
jgi:hypothetical protein